MKSRRKSAPVKRLKLSVAPASWLASAPSGPPLIEIIGGLIGMFLFAALMVWAAGRAFRAGALSDVKLSWKSFVGAVTGR